jgi:hypothetical protein
MPMTKLQATVTVAWWWKFYVSGVCFFSALLLREPNMERVRFWAGRAVRVRLQEVKQK